MKLMEFVWRVSRAMFFIVFGALMAFIFSGCTIIPIYNQEARQPRYESTGFDYAIQESRRLKAREDYLRDQKTGDVVYRQPRSIER